MNKIVFQSNEKQLKRADLVAILTSLEVSQPESMASYIFLHLLEDVPYEGLKYKCPFK